MTINTQQQNLTRESERLLTDPTGNTSRLQQQILEAATPTLPGVLDQLNEAGSTAAGAFDVAEGSLERRQRALGRPLSEGERRVQQRRLGLRRALSRVDARNRAVQGIRQRADIARSSASGLRDIIEGQVLSGRTELAGAESQREADFQQQMAQFRANRAGTLGTIAGIGLSFVPGGAFLAPAVGGAVS
jgi:hypothetical protein